MDGEKFTPQPLPAGVKPKWEGSLKRAFEKGETYTLDAGDFVMVSGGDKVCKLTTPVVCDLSATPYVPKDREYLEAGVVSLVPTSVEAHAEYLNQLEIAKEIEAEEARRPDELKLQGEASIKNPYREMLLNRKAESEAKLKELRIKTARDILRQNPEIREALGNPDPEAEDLELFDLKIAVENEVSQKDVQVPEKTEKDWNQERLRRLMDVYEVLNNWGLYPKEYVIGSFRRGKLQNNWDIDFAFKEFEEKEQRPIWSFVCEDADGKSFFVKAVTDPTHPWAPLESKREMYFYQEAQSAILQEMEAAVLDIGMPTLEKTTDDGNIIVLSYIEGDDISAQHFEIKPDFDQGDAQTIHNFILKFHGKPLSWWRGKAPKFLDTFGDFLTEDPLSKKLAAHRDLFNMREDRLKLFTPLIGDQNVRRMRDMLEIGEKLFKLEEGKSSEDQVTYVNNNLNAGGFMKGKDGKIYVMDWQVGQVTHPAIASAYFIESLWQNPELYDKALRQTLGKYKNDEKAREFLRYELVYLRLSGVAVRFYEGIARDERKTSEEREHAKAAKVELAKRIIEAIELEGVWKDYYTDADQWTKWAKVMQ